MKVKITDIDWDTGDDRPELPSKALINIPEDVIGEFIVDAVSNKFGWCIKTCNYEIVSDGNAHHAGSGALLFLPADAAKGDKMNDEKYIDGVLHHRESDKSDWIPYTSEELSIMLQIERNNSELQYVRGQRDTIQEHIDKMKTMKDKLFSIPI